MFVDGVTVGLVVEGDFCACTVVLETRDLRIVPSGEFWVQEENKMNT